MAGIMSRAKDIAEVTKLMNECKGMGIETLGPDINFSRHKFSVDPGGNIRFGLSAISGLGASAVDAIVKERDANGPYADIFDFAKRVPISMVKRSGLECLALSGAFDTFSKQISREQFFARGPKDETFIDTLTRFSTQYQQAQQDAQMSLFGGLDAVEISVPPIPAAERWSTLERLNREKEKIGIYLSAHPLDEYAVVLKGMCNVHMDQMADLTALQNREVRIGGIVTALRKGVSRTGHPYGIVTIEDYSGSGELALFGMNWTNWSNFMEQGYTLYIVGRVQPKKYRQDSFDFIIDRIDFLASVKEKEIHSVTISFNLENLDEDFVFSLADYAKRNPGPTTLQFGIYELGQEMHLSTVAKRHHIAATQELLDLLDKQPHMTYRIN